MYRGGKMRIKGKTQSDKDEMLQQHPFNILDTAFPSYKRTAFCGA